MKKLARHQRNFSPVLIDKAPVVFSIPRPYEDDDFKRSAGWFVKMRQMETKIERLRKQFLEIATRNEERMCKTTSLVASTHEFINNLQVKRNGGKAKYRSSI